MRFHYTLTTTIGCKISFEYSGSRSKEKIMIGCIILLHF